MIVQTWARPKYAKWKIVACRGCCCWCCERYRIFSSFPNDIIIWHSMHFSFNSLLEFRKATKKQKEWEKQQRGTKVESARDGERKIKKCCDALKIAKCERQWFVQFGCYAKIYAIPLELIRAATLQRLFLFPHIQYSMNYHSLSSSTGFFFYYFRCFIVRLMFPFSASIQRYSFCFDSSSSLWI